MTFTENDVQHCLDRLVTAEPAIDIWDYNQLSRESGKNRRPVSSDWFAWAKAEIETCPSARQVVWGTVAKFYVRLFRVAFSYYCHISGDRSMPEYRFTEFAVEVVTMHNVAWRQDMKRQCKKFIGSMCFCNYLLFNTHTSEKDASGDSIMDFLRISPVGRDKFEEWTGTKEPFIEPENSEIPKIENEISDEENKAPKPSTQHKNVDKAMSAFQRKFNRLIEGHVGRQYDDDGCMTKATVDGKVISFATSPIGKVAKSIFGGIFGKEAFTIEIIELALNDAGLERSGAKKVIEIMEAAVIKAKHGQLLKGADKPKVFVHDPGQSRRGHQQYITKLTFE